MCVVDIICVHVTTVYTDDSCKSMPPKHSLSMKRCSLNETMRLYWTACLCVFMFVCTRVCVCVCVHTCRHVHACAGRGRITCSIVWGSVGSVLLKAIKQP